MVRVDALLLLVVLTPFYSFLAPLGTQAQPQSRYSSTTECIGESESLACVSCDTFVTVSPSLGLNCRPIVEQDQSLHNVICTELEDVIKSIARRHTVHVPLGCIEVLIEPREEGDPYIVKADPDWVITQSVVLREIEPLPRMRRQMDPTPTEAPMGQPKGQVVVSLETNDGQPLTEVGVVSYILSFRNSSLVGISGVTFQNGPGRIEMEDVEVVVIESSIFEFFSQGALDIFNCPTVFVSDTTIRHNGPVTSQELAEYRGDSAGLSVALNKGSSGNGPSLYLRISNCTFRNNSSGQDSTTEVFTNTTDNTTSASPPATNSTNQGDPPPGGMEGEPNRGPSLKGMQFETIGSVVGGRLQFRARGGGLALIVNDQDPADVAVQGCKFRDNFGFAFGGGMYIGLDGKSRHSVVVNQSEFNKNTSPSTGGGLHISFLEEGETGYDNSVRVIDTNFTDNEAVYGGGVFFLPLDINLSSVSAGNSQIGVFVQFERCSFIKNTAEEAGGALGGAFHILAVNTKPLNIVDCTFEKNTVTRAGVVSIAFYPLNFYGTNTFLNNGGVSIAVTGSRMTVYGRLVIKDNNNRGFMDGGALLVSSQGQIELTTGAEITFINNTGLTGAALYVKAPYVPPLYSRLASNPLCVFSFENSNVSPDLWHTFNVSVNFIENVAMVSSAVYINNLGLCSWVSSSYPYFDPKKVFYWDFVNYTNNLNKAHGSSTDPRWAVQTPAIEMEIGKDELLIFPGQMMPLAISGYDEFGDPTTVAALIVDNFQEQGKFKFSPSSVSLNQVNTTLGFSYAMTTTTMEDRHKILALSLLEPNRRVNVQTSFSINPRSCPAGLKLITMQDISMCVCDEERVDIVTCNGRLVTLNTHIWGTRVLSPDRDIIVNPLATFPCPPGYCNVTCSMETTSGQMTCNFIFDAFAQDLQCSCFRKGVLCGGCTKDRGFSVLFNKCVSCDSLYPLVILVLTVADIVIIMLLLIVMKPIPLWVYPALYHLQLLPHFTDHFPLTFELVQPYLFYVVSATGLYFPYDFCLHSDLDAPGAYALRYLPLTLAVVVTTIFLIIRTKVCRPCSWHGVWWIILLLYTPVLHTSMSVLNCPIISFGNTTVPRWYANGNIECFSGTHIPLGLFAIFVLASCVALIPIVILVSLGKVSFPRWLRHLEGPLTDAYKDCYKWWAGIELGKRIIFVLFTVAFPNNNYAVIITLMVFICISGYSKPYKQKRINVLDLFLACDILVLLLLRNMPHLEESYQDFTQQLIPLPPSNETLCETRFNGVTAFVAILTPFYYLPLAISLGVFLFWLFYKLYLVCKLEVVPRYTKKPKGINKRNLSVISTKEDRPRTRTVVDMNDLESEPPTPSFHSKTVQESVAMTTIIKQNPSPTNYFSLTEEKSFGDELEKTTRVEFKVSSV